ncbi:MAG: insulinase family protein [Candidatus Eremiobacteraeota bacterium]|nr:insulinase family protein [Candidatus Eremiobacteraeota bacterium]
MPSSIARIASAVALVALLGAVPQPVPVRAPASDTSVTRDTLANGLRVVIVRDPLAPVVTVYENYLAGANETPDGFPGMAHAQEHMAFRGCTGVSGDQTSALFAQLGGDGDADTQQDITQFFETVPAADLDIALQLDAACMRGVDDSEDEWASERPAIEQEVASDLSSPGYLAFTRLSADLFAGTPYAHDPLGTRASFDKTTGALIKDYATSWYAPNDAVLVIAGDVDPQAALATIHTLYGSIPSRPLPARPAVSLSPVKAETFSLDSDLPYVVVNQAYRFPGMDDPDYAASRVLADVLGSARGDIFGLTPQNKALQSGFQLVATYPKASEAQAFGALASGADPKPLEAALSTLVAKAARDGVSPELVEAAKRSELAQSQFGRNSIPDLASAWSSAIADEGRSSPDDDVAAIAKVTVDDVNRVAKKVLDPAASVTAVLVPRPSGKAIASKGFGGGETLSSPPTKPVELPVWAKDKLAQVDVPASTLSPSDTTLPNGVRLIVQPETASDTVTVFGSIRHNDNLQTPAGKDGASTLLDDLFSYGTTSLDRLDYQNALDDIAATETSGTEFTLHVLKSHFDRGVQLLADDELHPALPPSDFKVVRNQETVAAAGEQQSPAYFASRALRRSLLPPGDPALRVATPDTIARDTLDDVRAYHNAVYRPDMTTIVVLGNVTPDEAKATIEKYFGAWKASGPAPRVDLGPIPPNAPSTAVVPDRSRVQDTAVLAETVAISRTDPQYYALQLGNNVLGGGFYATRLYHDLRQVAGLVYSVDVQFSAGKTRSTYVVSYGCDPKNVSKAHRLIARDLFALQKTDVTPGELQQAKAILLRQLPLGEASEDSVASRLAAYAESGLPLDEGHRGAAVYAKLTAADIRAAFAKYVRPAAFVEVVQGPTPS